MSHYEISESHSIPPEKGVSPKPLNPKKFPHPPSGSSNTPPSTIENIEHLLSKYGISAKYNTTKKKLQITQTDDEGKIKTDNADNVALTKIISLVALNGMSTAQVPAYVEAIAEKNAFSPVATWIESVPWDRKDRIPEIVATVKAREGFPEGFKGTLIYKWLLSAVAAIYKPVGFKTRGVLTLVGPQSCGKTSWTTALVSDPELRSSVIRVDHHLDALNKDSIYTAISHWIVEIGELDSSFKKDVARLKGFLTSTEDKLRRPYAKGDSEYPRRTVFIATVNDQSFLVDRTGNTRFWTIPVVSLDYLHQVDMQQVFAQLLEDYKIGKEWWLTPEEEDQLEYRNQDHLSVSVIQEKLMEYIDLSRIGHPNNERMAAIDVLEWIGIRNPTNAQCKECAAILRSLLGESKKHEGRQKWHIPRKLDQAEQQRPTRHPDHMF